MHLAFFIALAKDFFQYSYTKMMVFNYSNTNNKEIENVLKLEL